MIIDFTPIRSETPLTVIRTGDILTLNGEDFDFGPIPEGATLPRAAIASAWFAGDVARVEGALQITLLLPHGSDAPPQTRYPTDLTVTRDGQVAIPPYELTKAGEHE